MAQSNGKVAPGLAKKSGQQDVLLVYSSMPGTAEEAKLKKYGTIKVRLNGSRVIAATVNTANIAELIAELIADPKLLYVAPVRKVRPAVDNSTAAVGMTAGIRTQWTGKGIGVAVIDSGVDPHWDLKLGPVKRIVYQESFVAGGTANVQDSYGHGT